MRDVTDPADVPRTVMAVATLASHNGWAGRLTLADGPPPSIALRLRRGRRRLFGVWLLDKGVRWRGGATNDMRHLRTLAQLKAELQHEAE